MIVDIFLHNGLIVSEHGAFHGGIAIRNGTIHSLVREGVHVQAKKTIDLEGKIILPGVVDGHVHFHDPGRAYWEGYRTGSMAAAAGGITTVIEMPLNGIPPTIDRQKLIEKREKIGGRSVVDYAHWAGLVDDNVDEMQDLADAGVVAFKAFMSGAATEEFTGVQDRQLYGGLLKTAQLGTVLGLHAENGSVIEYLEAKLQSEGRCDPAAWTESRPPETELDAIQRALFWAKQTGGNAHIVHVSLAEGVQAVSAAKAAGVHISVETCPHFLVFNEEDFLQRGAELKCDPPLRPKDEVERLWDAVLDGQVDVIASDHAPCRVEDKLQGDGDIWQAWAGITGIQSMLPSIWTEGVQKRGLPMTEVVRMMCSNPARLFGLFPKKGALLPGSDADLVVLDPQAGQELTHDDLLNKNKHSPYVGRHLHGQIVQSYVRGRCVYDRGEILVEPGHGRLIAQRARYQPF